MNSETVVRFLQRGFHVTLGATASVVEILQDPQRRDANLNRLRLEWNQLSEEWATRGEVTEREARSYVDQWVAERRNSAEPPTVTTTATTVITSPKTDAQQELQELTAQLAAMRAELERLRQERQS
jgi:polyhydroxyalkanoate synthesis regulator phasin